jgi:hypothetical protein
VAQAVIRLNLRALRSLFHRAIPVNRQSTSRRVVRFSRKKCKKVCRVSALSIGPLSYRIVVDRRTLPHPGGPMRINRRSGLF